MAAVDYFLKIKGIEGEREDDKHAKEIDVESWSWGEANSGTQAYGGGGTAGKVRMNDFTFSMRVNKASPKLFLACANGEAISEALLTARKAGKSAQEYLKIKFSDLTISSFQTGGKTGDVVPLDNVTFSFAKIEISYAPQKKDGTLDSPVVHNYDLKKNKGG